MKENRNGGFNHEENNDLCHFLSKLVRTSKY